MKKPMLLSFVILLAALMLSSCIVLPALKSTASPSASAPPAATAAPVSSASAASAAPAIDYAPVAVKAGEFFSRLTMGMTVNDAAAMMGNPVAIYGQGSYEYRAIAGSGDSVPAAVYRFVVDGVPIELIGASADNAILKKQISTPDVLQKLVGDASAIEIADGSPYADALKLLGKNPYLWAEFTAPHPDRNAGSYQVLVWPDGKGQLAALVKDGIVLRCEYQPAGVALAAAAVDGITPRIPRFLTPLPSNANQNVTANTLFQKFAALNMNASEQSILAAFGQPISVDTSNSSVKSLLYEFADASFSNGKATFVLTLTAGDAAVLVAKKAILFPAKSVGLNARYAQQILGGMKKTDVEAFLGAGYACDQKVDSDGRIVATLCWAGDRANAGALIPQGSDTVTGNDCAVYDTQEEAATLYEEYVLLKSAPAVSATPVPTALSVPTATPSIQVKPPILTFSFKLPSLSLTIPSLSIQPVTLKPLPTPTPVKSGKIPLISIKPLVTATPAPTLIPLISLKP